MTDGLSDTLERSSLSRSPFSLSPFSLAPLSHLLKREKLNQIAAERGGRIKGNMSLNERRRESERMRRREGKKWPNSFDVSLQERTASISASRPRYPDSCCLPARPPILCVSGDPYPRRKSPVIEYCAYIRADGPTDGGGRGRTRTRRASARRARGRGRPPSEEGGEKRRNAALVVRCRGRSRTRSDGRTRTDSESQALQPEPKYVQSCFGATKSLAGHGQWNTDETERIT